MLSPQEFAAAWGEDRFRFPPDVLQGIDIPEAAKAFLLEAGLPRRLEVPTGPHAVLLPASSPLPLLSRYRSTPFRLLACRHEDEASSFDNDYMLFRKGQAISTK